MGGVFKPGSDFLIRRPDAVAPFPAPHFVKRWPRHPPSQSRVPAHAAPSCCTAQVGLTKMSRKDERPRPQRCGHCATPGRGPSRQRNTLLFKERKSVGKGKSVAVRVDLGGGRHV